MAGAERHEDERVPAGGMVTTTVRFDAETWEAIEREARRRGMSKAALIRDATVAQLARVEAAALVRAELSAELEALGDLRRRVSIVEAALRRLLGPRRR